MNPRNIQHESDHEEKKSRAIGRFAFGEHEEEKRGQMVRYIAPYLTDSCKVFYFAPSGRKIFAYFVTQGVALG